MNDKIVRCSEYFQKLINGDGAVEYGGRVLQWEIIKIMKKIWQKLSWGSVLLRLILKKGDITVCDNYRGIAVQECDYKQSL